MRKCHRVVLGKCIKLYFVSNFSITAIDIVKYIKQFYFNAFFVNTQFLHDTKVKLDPSNNKTIKNNYNNDIS